MDDQDDARGGEKPSEQPHPIAKAGDSKGALGGEEVVVRHEASGQRPGDGRAAAVAAADCPNHQDKHQQEVFDPLDRQQPGDQAERRRRQADGGHGDSVGEVATKHRLKQYGIDPYKASCSVPASAMEEGASPPPVSGGGPGPPAHGSRAERAMRAFEALGGVIGPFLFNGGGDGGAGGGGGPSVRPR